MSSEKENTQLEKFLQNLEKTQLSNGQESSVLNNPNDDAVCGGINWYDCQNPSACSDSTNVISCDNDKVCLTNPDIKA